MCRYTGNYKKDLEHHKINCLEGNYKSTLFERVVSWDYKKNMMHKLNTNKPEEIIKWININYPKYSGMCFYEDKMFKSKAPNKVNFHFDTYHNVLTIKNV